MDHVDAGTRAPARGRDTRALTVTLALVAAYMVVVIAGGGLLVNLVGLWVLHAEHATGARGSLNVHGAWLHVLTDTLGSVQAIIAGVLIWTVGWHWVDPLASVLIALLVVYSAWELL